MNESIKKKINGIGEAGNVISIILIILASIACFLLITGLVLLTFLPKDAATLGIQIDADATVGKSLIGPYLDDIDVSNLKDMNISISGGGSVSGRVNGMIEKTEEGLTASFSTSHITIPSFRMAYGVLAAIGKCLASLIVLIVLNKLSREFKKCDTPFAEGVIRWMTVFAWVLLGASVFSQIVTAGASALIFKEGGFQLKLNLTMVFVTLIVLFLTMIFRYGAKLQQESDETL